MKLNLKEIQARCEAATEGPWYENFSISDGSEVVAADSAVCCIREGCTERGYANMLFLSHARTDIPALLKEVERLRNACRMAYQGLCTDDEEAQQRAIALIDALETE